ncbi:MAG: hypothetical protein JSS14_12120 [Proteobacteria bacterium]|nr:hypothetical protein [Pseudomonadota bacterium]
MPRLLNAIVRISWRPGRLPRLVRPLRIAQDDPLQLAIDSRRGTFVADHRRRTLSRNGRVLARFKDIQSVDVVSERTDGIGGHWAIWARVGPLMRVKIGDTDDDLHAALVAARLTAAMVVGNGPVPPMELMPGS